MILDRGDRAMKTLLVSSVYSRNSERVLSFV